MQVYPVKVTRNYPLVASMVIVPLLGLAPGIYIMARYLPNLGETAAFSFIFGMMVLVLGLTFYLVKQCITAGSLTIANNKLQFQFADKGMLSLKSFELDASQIRSYNIGGRGDKLYIMLGLTRAPYSIGVEAAEKNEAAETQFREALVEMVELIKNHNELSTAPIAYKNFYNTWWMKLLLLIVLLLTVVKIVADIFG